jgi:hypothetical protein
MVHVTLAKARTHFGDYFLDRREIFNLISRDIEAGPHR